MEKKGGGLESGLNCALTMLQCSGPPRMKYCIRVSIGTCHIPSEVSRNFLFTVGQRQN